MASEPPKVLISYSHDSSKHAERALELANRLREDGVDCMIDQYVVVPEEGWPLWMEGQIRDSNFVLMICTETYYKRVVGQEHPGKGLGVRWEGNLIYSEIYRAGTMNTKFIPVFFESGDSSHVPGPARDTKHYSVGTEEGYEELYRRLTDQPRVIKPELGKLRSLPPAERKSEGTAGLEVVFSNLPDRNPFFTGRELVLTQLQEALAERGRAALSGLGGVGKTQTAVEYAHRHLAEYTHAFWATAASREGLLSGYVTIAGLLTLPEAGAQDQTVAVGAVQRWLGSHEGWLLILDNVDDLGTAREFIPRGKSGHVLLTTRAGAVGAVARLVKIQEMAIQEGALFLLRRAKCIAENALLGATGLANQEKAREIVMQLGGLPLALDQGAAYVEETGCGLSGYLDLYRSQALELLRRRGALESDHPNEALKSDHRDPVATTWALSFEKIEKANPAATELLRLCAFLNADGIPEEVFREGASELGPVLGPVGSDALAWNDALSEILKYSLLRRDPNARTLEIHRLVQTVLKRGMDEATRRLWAERAVRTVNRAFPSVEFSTWPLCERLLPQAHACGELINQWGFEFPDAAGLLNEAGSYLNERGRYTDAEPLYTRALAIREKALGPEDPLVATSLNNLAVLYNRQGQYAKAEPLYNRALAIWKKALGPEHPLVATSLNNLAGLYNRQGQYAKAEPLYNRALAIWKKALGPEHPHLAQSLNNLALLYNDRGQYAKAEPLYNRPLAIREKALGPEHPHLAESLNNLALLYNRQGQYAKAGPLYNRALAILEKALGPEHPDVAQSLNGLAGLLSDTNRLAEAEPLYQRALAIREKAFGPEHPDVVTTLENYALLLRAMDRPEEAARLEARVRAIRAKSA